MDLRRSEEEEENDEQEENASKQKHTHSDIRSRRVQKLNRHGLSR